MFCAVLGLGTGRAIRSSSWPVAAACPSARACVGCTGWSGLVSSRKGTRLQREFFFAIEQLACQQFPRLHIPCQSHRGYPTESAPPMLCVLQNNPVPFRAYGVTPAWIMYSRHPEQEHVSCNNVGPRTRIRFNVDSIFVYMYSEYLACARRHEMRYVNSFTIDWVVADGVVLPLQCILI